MTFFENMRVCFAILGMAGSWLGFMEAEWYEKVKWYDDLFHIYTMTEEFKNGIEGDDFEAGVPSEAFSFWSFADWLDETMGSHSNAKINDLIRYLLYTKQIKKDIYWNTRIYRLTKNFR